MSIEVFGVDAAITNQTTVVAGATANTKGAWTELIAATAQDFDGIYFSTGRGSVSEYMFDIAIGPAGAEQIIIDNWHHSLPTTGNYRIQSGVMFPIFIKAGTRISARAQSSVAGSAQAVSGYGFLRVGTERNYSLANDVVTFGANTADSGGTEILGVASAAGYGPWTQLTASTPRKLSAILLHFGLMAKTTRDTSYMLFQVGVGSAGNEVAIFSGVRYISSITDVTAEQITMPYLVNVPQGSRLSVRIYYSAAGTNSLKTVDCILYGV